MTLDTQKSINTYIWNLLTTEGSDLETAMGGTVRLYLTWAKPNATFPYLVHRMDIAPLEPFPMRQATYYLDIWSDNPSADEIRLIRKRIIELLDELIFSTDEASNVRVSLQAEGFIPEVEQGIWHYATQWNFRYYRVAETAAIIGR